MKTDNAIKINDNDNVVVALSNIEKGDNVFGISAAEIGRAHV